MSAALALPAAPPWASPLWRAVDRIAAAQPEAAARARRALSTLTRALSASGQAAGPGSLGRLTGDGFPVELVFASDASAMGALRYTAEAGGPAIPLRARLDAAAALLAELGAPAPALAACEALRAVQPPGALGFGAWIGGRHTAAADRYKLYAEVSPAGASAADALARRWLGAGDLLPGSAAPRPRILAHEPGTGGWEIYWRADGLEPWRLGALLARAGLEARQRDLLDLVGRVWGRPIRDALPGAKVGVSYALAADGRPEAFSLFFFASALWGADRRIRERMLALAGELGWQLPAYREVTASLEQRSTWQTRHGLLAFVVLRPAAGEERLLVHLGLRPPEAEEARR